MLHAAAINQLFGDRFASLQESGAGGMGTIYRAIDRRSGVSVALKILRDKQGPSAERFDQEAALLKEVEHPAIVRYVAHGSAATGERFLAMEWLDGETLEDRLLRGPLGVLATVRLGKRVLEALQVAHAHKIVHRDIKPSNLFLPAGALEELKIIDFGIARRMFDARRITLVGSTLGTPMYMSPEQARGSAEIDARADVFSLGCVLFECLTGQPPFTGESPVAVLAKICLDDSLDVEQRCPGMPRELAALLGRMLAKEADARPPHAGELAAELGRLAERLASEGHGEESAHFRVLTPPPVTHPDTARILCAVMVSWPRPIFGLGSESSASMPAMLASSTWEGTGTGASGSLPRMSAASPGVETLRKLVEPYGARLDRLLDGSMVVTLLEQGTVAAVDEVARAARCALLLRDFLPGAAFALSTGRAVRGAALPIGDVLDIAARLLFGEPPGTICADEVSARLLAARFEVAGGARHHLLFEKGLRYPPRTIAGRALPFLGRDRELQTLEALYSECVDERVARVALVTAPSGGGKGRLLQELFERLFSRAEPFECLSARAASATWALGALGAALRRAAGVTGREPEPAQRRKLEVHFGRALAPERAAAVVPWLGEIAGVAFPEDDSSALEAARRDPQLMADAQLGAWLEWLEAATGSMPVVIAIADAERADRASLAFIEAAVRVCADRPVFVLALGKPEADELWHEAAPKRDDLRLPLGPLTSKACGRLSAHVLGDLGDERAVWLTERAGGRPWAIEEILRAAAAGGEALTERGALAPPEALLLARLDRLRPEDRLLLDAASVVGEGASVAELKAALGPRAPGELEARLRGLCAAELLFGWREDDQDVIAFVHAPLREAIYGALPAAEWQHLHAGTAHLAPRPSLDAAARAAHLILADLSVEATDLLAAASNRALAAGDARGALEVAQRGLVDELPAPASGLLRLAEARAHLALGDVAAAESASREALVHLEGPERLTATAALFEALGRVRRFDELARLVGETLGTDVAVTAPIQHAECLVVAARAYLATGAEAEGENLLRHAEVAARGLGPHLVACVRELRGDLERGRGEIAAAVTAYEGALKGAVNLGDARRVARIRRQLGGILGGLGVLEAAEAHLREALAIVERLGPVRLVRTILIELAGVLTANGRRFEARMAAERALEQARQARDRADESLAGAALGRVLLAEGDAEHAEDHARAAIEAGRASRSPIYVPLAVLARSLLAQGRVPEARECAGDAHARLENALLGARPAPTTPSQGLATLPPSVSSGSSATLPQLGSPASGKRLVEVPDEGLVRLACSEAFAASGDLSMARRVLEKACGRLEERAGVLGRAEWRASFLQRLPDHAKTIALRSQWRLGG